jgi:hypothetical protein
LAPVSLWDLPQHRVKIRSGVCLAKRRWSSRLRLGKVEESARLYVCARCREQVIICRCCDRGQRYCAGACAAAARKEAQRAAGRRYQQSLRGRRQHAQRGQRYRENRRTAQKVTHQGDVAMGESETRGVEKTEAARTPTDTKEVPDEARETIHPSAPSAREPVAERPLHAPSPEPPCCAFCHRPCGPWLRQVPLSRRVGRAERPAQARGDPRGEWEG